MIINHALKTETMDCRRYMLKFLAGMLLIGMPVLSSAIDLPIKKIDGKDYYYYNVKAKETVFGLCRNLNLTKAEIVKYNPSVADGLRAGDVLYFPVELLDSKQPEQPAKNSYDNSGVGSIHISQSCCCPTAKARSRQSVTTIINMLPTHIKRLNRSVPIHQ